jgi:hypothetical protein
MYTMVLGVLGADRRTGPGEQRRTLLHAVVRQRGGTVPPSNARRLAAGLL